MKKKTYIVRKYNSYEWINTDQAYCKLQLLIKYHRKGWQVWEYPMWFAKLVYKLFGKRIYGDRDCYIEKLIPGSDQITHHSPFDNW